MKKTNTMLRSWRSYNLAELSARIGRSKSHIWRVLKGQRKPGKELAAVLVEMGFKVEGFNHGFHGLTRIESV